MLTIDVPCPACEAPAGRNCRRAGTVTCPERLHASVASVGINPSLFAGGWPEIPEPWTMREIHSWVTARDLFKGVPKSCVVTDHGNDTRTNRLDS